MKRPCLHVTAASIRTVETITFHTNPKDHSTYLKEVTDSGAKRNWLKCSCGYLHVLVDFHVMHVGSSVHALNWYDVVLPQDPYFSYTSLSSCTLNEELLCNYAWYVLMHGNVQQLCCLLFSNCMCLLTLFVTETLESIDSQEGKQMNIGIPRKAEIYDGFLLMSLLNWLQDFSSKKLQKVFMLINPPGCIADFG